MEQKRKADAQKRNSSFQVVEATEIEKIEVEPIKKIKTDAKLPTTKEEIEEDLKERQEFH